MDFAIHQHESATGICVPPILSPHPPSSPSHHSGSPKSTGFGCHASCPVVSILHMVIYMFQFYSIKASHPHELLLSPKVCSLCLCVLCCPSGSIGYCLSKLHMHTLIYNICLSFSDLLNSV